MMSVAKVQGSRVKSKAEEKKKSHKPHEGRDELSHLRKQV